MKHHLLRTLIRDTFLGSPEKNFYQRDATESKDNMEKNMLNERQLRRIIRQETSRILREVGESSNTQKIKTIDGKLVLLSSGTKNHISAHGKPGVGSVFSGENYIDKIVSKIESLSIPDGGGAIEIKDVGTDVGYDLVLPFEDAQSLPDAKETTVKKQERGNDIEVPAFETSAPIEKFKTSMMTVVIRPTNRQFLPPDLANDEEVDSALASGNAYSVLTAWPGASNVPAASQWAGKWAVVIPGKEAVKTSDKANTAGGGKEANESINKSGEFLVERWQRLAGLLK